MSLINRRLLVCVALFLATLRPATADEPLPVCAITGSRFEVEEQNEPYHCWWMPKKCCGAKCDLPYGFEAYPPAGNDSLPTPSPTLIEEAESLLETPRIAQHWGGTFVDVTDTAQLSGRIIGDQFSQAWSDGAPLLLFDWSGKSGNLLAAPALRQDGVQRVASSTAASDFGDLSGKVKLRERDAQLDPSGRSNWETDQTVKVPVAGSLFIFNQVSGSTPDVDQQQYKWLGKSGVGLKLKPWLLQEVQVRTGPAVRYDDTGTLTKGQSPERSELFLEAVTKLPLPLVGPINVEYSSYAVPAANSTDHTNEINQDFKLALPIGGGQFHVGAKYKWESASTTPWMDRMEVYLGVQNKW